MGEPVCVGAGFDDLAGKVNRSTIAAQSRGSVKGLVHEVNASLEGGSRPVRSSTYEPHRSPGYHSSQLRPDSSAIVACRSILLG